MDSWVVCVFIFSPCTKCARILLGIVSWNHALFSGLLLIMTDNSNSVKVDRISAWHWLINQSKNVWEAKFPKCQQRVPGMFLDLSLCITGPNLATGTVWPPSFSFNSHSLCLSSLLGRLKKKKKIESLISYVSEIPSWRVVNMNDFLVTEAFPRLYFTN